MRENILKKESEVTMVEALTKMANVHEVIVASLDQAAANGVSSPGGSAR
jgi:[calcium/calmodulin-dependent protein kinase] kinase